RPPPPPVAGRRLCRGSKQEATARLKAHELEVTRREPSVAAERGPLSDQEFAEPVALSSTSPADFPLGHLPKDQPSTYSRPVKLRPSRAPCSAQDRAYLAGAVAGKEPPRNRPHFAEIRTTARSGRPIRR